MHIYRIETFYSLIHLLKQTKNHYNNTTLIYRIMYYGLECAPVASERMKLKLVKSEIHTNL